MKKLILLTLVAGATWWYFVGGRTLTQDHVAGFYQDLERATLARQPEGICSLLAPGFRSSAAVDAAGSTRTEEQDRAQVCENYRSLYATWHELGEKLGGTLQLDSAYTIHSVEISADGKTATVDISSSLDVAGSVMRLRSRSTDTLIRRNGKVLMLRSEGVGFIGMGS